MTKTLGWATLDSTTEDGFAHEIVRVDTNVHGGTVWESLCGQFSGGSWAIAGPGVLRCRECQNVAAGSPD